mgnify:FL=1
MKKIYLLIALFASPAFAQEEEQEVQIEIETGGGVEVATYRRSGSNYWDAGVHDCPYFLTTRARLYI